MKIGLTDCEEIVMNTIWLMESKGEKHITLPMILLEVNLQHKKEWKPPTVLSEFWVYVEKAGIKYLLFLRINASQKGVFVI